MKIISELPHGFLDEPYAEQADPLSRSDLSKRLAALYGNLEHGTVAILHGRWGSGKSTFARKWLAHLQLQGFGTIYFDAFENDYINDPFIALNAALVRKLNTLPDRGGKKGIELKKGAVAVSKKLLMASAKVGVKALTFGALELADLELAEEVSSFASDTAAELSEAAVQKLLDEYSQADETFSAFRKSLGMTPELLSKRDTLGTGKVVFVIDELDRCRPDFALGLIECLKHFFKTQSLHFVLVANKEFLVRSVEDRYGLNSASEEYLDKFFDFSIMFEESSRNRHASQNVIYAKKILSDLIGNNRQDNYDLNEYISEISGAFNLTYRQCEKIATNAALAYHSFGENEFRPTILISYLCFLKAIYPSIYQDIKLRKFNFSKFKEIMESGNWDENSSNERVLTVFEYHLEKVIEGNDQKYEGIIGTYGRYNFGNRLEILPYLANSVVDRFSR